MVTPGRPGEWEVWDGRRLVAVYPCLAKATRRDIRLLLVEIAREEARAKRAAELRAAKKKIQPSNKGSSTSTT